MNKSKLLILILFIVCLFFPITFNMVYGVVIQESNFYTFETNPFIRSIEGTGTLSIVDDKLNLYSTDSMRIGYIKKTALNKIETLSSDVYINNDNIEDLTAFYLINNMIVTEGEITQIRYFNSCWLQYYSGDWSLSIGECLNAGCTSYNYFSEFSYIASFQYNTLYKMYYSQNGNDYNCYLTDEYNNVVANVSQYMFNNDYGYSGVGFIFTNTTIDNYNNTLYYNNNAPDSLIITRPNSTDEYTKAIYSNSSVYFEWDNLYDIENDSFNISISISNLINDYYIITLNQTELNYTYINTLNSYPSGYYYSVFNLCDAYSCNEIVSDDSFYICVNDYERKPNECLNNLELIEYVDLNNCNVLNDIPLNNGTYGYCEIQTTNTTEYSEDVITIFILFVLILICIVVGFKFSIVFYFVALFFAFLTGIFIYYNYPAITYICGILMTLLFVVIAIFKKD